MDQEQGYRLNVGIIVSNDKKQLVLLSALGFGMRGNFRRVEFMRERPAYAMYRELNEELGLDPEDVEIVAESKQW